MATKEYRERYKIIAHMLNIINDTGDRGASKTIIMYKAFLSYAQLKEYLSFLLEKGLVDEQTKTIHGNEKFVYNITRKGLRLLQISHQIDSIVGLD
jgi:predicted transcriptional regulator